MGKKKSRGQGQAARKATTISLFEFNQDVTVGTDPELASLPTAPKLAEEWEAEGGRPEYNSRGYKERRVDPYAEERADDDFDNRDWTRRGPVDGADEGGFGTGPERDWSKSRQGPLDSAGEGREVDFGGLRRGPVEAEFGGGARDVDFSGVRRGPVEAEFGSAGRDVDFGVRRGPVEAEFSGPGRDVDFGVRKGPIEAEFANAGRDVDFGVRKGPVEAEFAGASRDVDFGIRKGPVEAEFAASKPQVDFAVRKGPVDADFGGAGRREVDFGGMRRGPVEAESRAPTRNFAAMRRGPIDAEPRHVAPSGGRDFGSMRRGARPAAAHDDGVGATTRQPWRRRGAQEDTLSAGVGRMAIGERRDWGGARTASANTSVNVSADADDLARARNKPTAETTVANGIEITTEPDSEWTTVRTVEKRAPRNQTRAPRAAHQPLLPRREFDRN